MKRVVSVALAIVALAAAGVAVATAPEGPELVTAFPARGNQGDVVYSRTITVEVTDVRLGEKLDIEGEEPLDSTAIGAWIVVDAVATARLRSASTTSTELQIGNRAFRTSTILGTGNLANLPFGPDVPVGGSWVFDVPVDALEQAVASGAHLRVKTATTPQADTVPYIDLDIEGLELEPVQLIERSAVVDR